MKLNEQLNHTIQEINCTAKELSDITGLSPASISRYRTGERIPSTYQLNKLIDGLVLLAQNKKIPAITHESLQTVFQEYLEESLLDYDQFLVNLNVLFSTLEINLSELSRFLNFDSSYLSRIRLGQRRPSDLDSFILGVCQYVVHKKDLAVIQNLINDSSKESMTESSCMQALSQWLKNGVASNPDYVGNFLTKLDEFDLDEYIRAIHFDELKVPTVPFQIPTSKSYHGIEAMKQGELDFFKSTVLSKSMEPVFMCSDMPMEDMAEDVEFGKKWMFAIAMTLKKGLHLHIIHNIDRPFKEMMLGLESWIPLYMTGQVLPYYLKGKHNSVYCHFNYVSGQAALNGECIQGHHDEGKYYLTKNKEEIAYYRKKADRLLEKAHPLMEIYRSDAEKQFQTFLNTDAQMEGIRHNILSSLPVYTLPEEDLLALLNRHKASNDEKEKILAFAENERNRIETILQKNPVFDDVSLLSKEEFEKHPLVLSLSKAFFDKEYTYTYEEYLKHLNATQLFEKNHENYTLKADTAHAFRNIQIQIHEGKWVLVSKNKAPIIHFVIRHSKMLNAFENFIVPVIED